VVDQDAGGFDFSVHVGEHPLDGLEFADGFAESAAGAGVFDGLIEGALGKADGERGDADTAVVESGESDLEALAFFPEAGGDGDDAIVENDFDGGGTALAHFVFVAADFEAGCVGLEEEGGDSLPGRSGIGFGKDDEEAGSGAIGDPGFGAGEFVVIAIADSEGLDASGVGSGGGFGEAEGAEDFAGREAAKVAGSLFVGGVDEERGLHGGVGDRDGGGHGGVNFGDFFEHEDVGEGVEAWAAPLFGEQHAATTESAEFLDGVEGEMVSALPVFDVRADFGVHEVADGIADEEMVVGEGEVHFGDGSTGQEGIGHGDTEGTEGVKESEGESKVEQLKSGRVKQ